MRRISVQLVLKYKLNINYYCRRVIHCEQVANNSYIIVSKRLNRCRVQDTSLQLYRCKQRGGKVDVYFQHDFSDKVL